MNLESLVSTHSASDASGHLSRDTRDTNDAPERRIRALLGDDEPRLLRAYARLLRPAVSAP
jgi:hypothetical protein